MKHGLCLSDSSVSSVLKTLNPVTPACTGVGSVALDRLSARKSEVPWSFTNISCNHGGA